MKVVLTSRRERVTARAIPVVLGVLATVTPIHATGFAIADRLWTALFVAGVGIAATRARRWSLLVFAGIVGAFADSRTALAAAALAVLVAAAAAWVRRVLPVAGGLSGGLAAFAALHLHDVGFEGSGALLALLSAAPVLASAYARTRSPARKALRRAAVGFAGYGLLATLALGVTALGARSSIEQAAADLRQARTDLHAGRLDSAQVGLERARAPLGRAHTFLGGPGTALVRTIPLVGARVETLADTLRLAQELSSTTADALAVVVKPTATGQSGRFDLRVIEKLRPFAERLATSLKPSARLSSELSAAWFIPTVDDQMAELAHGLDQARTASTSLVDDLDGLVDLIGGHGTRRYLVLFVTPSEARANGFPGNFAELVVSDGRFSMPRFGRVSDLRMRRAADLRAVPASFRNHYARFGIATEWRSATISPDFPADARLAAELYRQSKGGRAVDGVLTVDPAALAALLKFTGPVRVDQSKAPLTTLNAEYFLLLGQYRTNAARRIDGLESLSRITFDRLVSKPLPEPSDLAKTLGPLIATSHIRMSAFRPGAAEFTAQSGLDHRLPDLDGTDGLAVVTSNAVGGKVDAFLSRSVAYTLDWQPDTGAVSGRIRITLRNGAPSHGLPAYVTGNALQDRTLKPGTNRMLLSVFSPLQATSVRVNGKSAGFVSSPEGDYTAYDVLVDVAPDNGTAVVEFAVSGRIAPGTQYDLSIWNQVLVHPDRATITIRADRTPTTTQLILDRPRSVHVSSR